MIKKIGRGIKKAVGKARKATPAGQVASKVGSPAKAVAEKVGSPAKAAARKSRGFMGARKSRAGGAAEAGGDSGGAFTGGGRFGARKTADSDTPKARGPRGMRGLMGRKRGG